MPYALPAPGDVIADKYVVERKLAQGGMGVVYAVSHKLTGKQLALKCLLPERALDPDIAARFLREAKAAGRLQHRHVVDIFDVDRHGALTFIVMELLEGKSLASLLEESLLNPAEALVIILRAMEGVAAAHQQGIIHRDLKPDNIFVCIGSSGRLDDPRVLDFGISKLDDGSTALTSTGAPMGTPYYMCLEQMRGQRDVDVRADVYALGVVLYEAIAGRRPYQADSMSALAIALLTTTPLPLDALRPDLPLGLSEVVMKAMARERDQRYPSVRALIEALEPFVSAFGAAREPPLGSLPTLDRGTVPTVSQQPTPSDRAATPMWLSSAVNADSSGQRASRSIGRALVAALVLGSLVAAWYLVPRAPGAPATAASSAPADRAPSAAPAMMPSSTQPAAAQPPAASAPAKLPEADPLHQAQPNQPSDPPRLRGRSPRAARMAESTPSAQDGHAAPSPAAAAQEPVSGRAGEMKLKEF